MKQTLKALGREEEIALLRSDDRNFGRAREYLAPLIRAAAERLDKPKEQESLQSELDGVVAVAAKRFLAQPKNIDARYKFSAYFTWYIAEALKRRQKVG